MKKITIPLVGGLGNQLFQIAAGEYLASKTRRAVVYSPVMLHSFFSRSNTVRAFDSRDLLLDKEINNDKTIALRIQLHARLKTSFLLAEFDDTLQTFLSVDHKTSLLTGYFQNHSMVDSVKEKILNRFQKFEKNDVVASHDGTGSIAVHIRYGDYRTNQQARSFHGLTSMSYFVSAVALLESQADYKNIMIFSDEPNVAVPEFLAAYRGLLPVTIHNPTESTLSNLIYMSKSSALVMSNSSFSWWAAWLGSIGGSCNVVAPTPWFAQPSKADATLLDPQWRPLNRDFS